MHVLIFPIDYCVRINALPYSVIDFLIVTASISKLLHSWLFIDLSEHHYTALTSKFNNFLNRSSTMLNNVFKVCLRECVRVFVNATSTFGSLKVPPEDEISIGR